MPRLNFKIDLVSAVKKQLGWDNDKKEREAAKKRADPIIAHRISQYHARYPHLTAGATLSAAKAGYDPEGPEIAKLAELAAKRKVDKGQGWYSPGDDPKLKENPRAWFEELAAETNYKPYKGSSGVFDALKPTIRATATFGQSLGEVIGATARTGARAYEDGDLSAMLNPLAGEKITGIEAIKKVASGKGSGLGHGYFPGGETSAAQAEAARANYSLEYADKPIFSLPGAPAQPVQKHAGTTGRILFKNIFEPGSFWFNAGSGIVDGVISVVADPAAKISKITAAKKAAKATFTAEEAGLTGAKVEGAVAKSADETTATTPFTDADIDPELVGKSKSEIDAILTTRRKTKVATDMGLVAGRRTTVHGPTMTNWLTTSNDGKTFVKWASANTDAYTIWKTMNGEGTQFSPLLARQIADTTDEAEMIKLLSPELGTGIKLKPEVGHLNHVGGAFEGVGISDNIRSVRMFGTMPRGTIDVDDLPDGATQLTRYLRNAKVPESAIAPHFDSYTRALTTEERVDVFRNVQWAAARHIAETELVKKSASFSTDTLNHNFNRLRGMYARDAEIMDRINKLHASRGTSVDSTIIDGELSAPLRTHWEDIEASRLFTFANPRDVKKITSTYGRLLSNKYIETPLLVLDHINNIMKGVNILRPALTIRVIGEQLVRMSVAGYDTIFNHPLSAIAWMTGKKGNLNVFGENIDSLDEYSKFRKSLVHHGDLHSKISMEHREVIPFTDRRFQTAWADDIDYLTRDPVASRLAGRWNSDDVVTGNHIEDTKKWLASDHPEAVAYRAENPEITADIISAYVDNINNTLTAKTYNNPTLMDAVRTGQFNGEPIITLTPGGKPKFSRAFRAHLKTLTDTDHSPELTIGDVDLSRNLDDIKDLPRNITDALFGYLLTKPGNYMNNSPTWKQQYWQSATDELIIHADPDVQKVLIQAAQDANLDPKAIAAMKKKAATGSGDLTLKEVDFHANARAAEAVSTLYYNLQDRGQFMDSARLIFPFGEAWKEALTVWARLTRAKPQIIPRGLMALNGARESGFIYTDPATGEEMFAYPGSAFINKHLFGGMPVPMQAPIGSLNMVTGGKNPYMPGFGILVQTPVAKFLPDVPKYDGLRELVTPYEPKDLSNPWNLLPSWAQPLRNYLGSPANEVAFMNSVKDVSAYLVSTGQYPMETQRDLERLEDRAIEIAKTMALVSGIAKSTLPATPSYQDVAQDKEGHTTLAFALSDDYRKFLEIDREKDTNLAVTSFIDKYGERNLLYMQSATKGGDVFTKSGYDWVRENADIVKSYPTIYGLLAPKDGGFDIKAYHALFENGTRKPLTPREMLEAANNRLAKMAYRYAQDKLPEPNRRTKAQKEWLRQVREELLASHQGFQPEFQGNDIPNTIRDLSEAVTDPRISSSPTGKAIAEYLTARDKVAKQALARKEPITSWQTAKSMSAQRKWLRDIASDITSRYPSFKEINRELFDQELTEDD